MLRLREPIPEDCVCELCAFVIDQSASMESEMSGASASGTRLRVSCEAVCRFVERKLAIERENPANTGAVALATFNTSAREVVGLTPISEAEARIRRAVNSMEADGNTDFCEGLALARKLLRRDHPAKAYPEVGFVDRIVFLTDGGHNGREDPRVLARQIRDEGILIFTIGVSDAITEDIEALLQDMASVIDGERWYRHVDGCDELIDCFEGLAGHITGRVG